MNLVKDKRISGGVRTRVFSTYRESETHPLPHSDMDDIIFHPYYIKNRVRGTRQALSTATFPYLDRVLHRDSGEQSPLWL
jgi:hypothetical protein